MATVLANDGVTISYRVHGEGPTTLLLMHGWAGSGAYFDEVIEELDLNALQIVTVDFRGHGDSEKTVHPYDQDRIADDVWSVADAAGVQNLILGGFSMSGKFAPYAALRQPERVTGLVLMGGFPPSPIPFPHDLLRDWVGRAGNRERLREMLAPFISDPVDAEVLDRFLDNAVKVPAPVLECTLQTCIDLSFADRVESLQMPTLIVGGQRDVFFPPQAVAQLARCLPCARGLSLPCNHEIPMERPRELAHVIEAFVCGLALGCRTAAADV